MASGAPRGCRGVRGHWDVGGALEVAGGLRAWPHWSPFQGPSTPIGSLGE